MTFQPPPPPPGGTPPPPPPPGGQYGPPPGGGQYGPPPSGQYGPPGNQPVRGGFDPKTVNQLDWGIVGAGVLALIFSMFDYYTVDVSFGGYSASASASAWHGFFGWFAALLALAGAGVVAMELFAPQVKLPVANRLAGLGLFAAATLCVILALFVFPGGDYSGAGVDEGHGFGYWLSLIVIIAGLVLSLMRFQQQGGQLPGALSGMPHIGGHGHGGPPAGSPPPPPPGYGQQPPPPPGYGPPQ